VPDSCHQSFFCSVWVFSVVISHNSVVFELWLTRCTESGAFGSTLVEFGLMNLRSCPLWLPRPFKSFGRTCCFEKAWLDLPRRQIVVTNSKYGLFSTPSSCFPSQCFVIFPLEVTIKCPGLLSSFKGSTWHGHLQAYIFSQSYQFVSLGLCFGGWLYSTNLVIF